MDIKYKCKNVEEQLMLMEHLATHMEMSCYYYVVDFGSPKNRYENVSGGILAHFHEYPYILWEDEGGYIAASSVSGYAIMCQTKEDFLKEIGCESMGNRTTIPRNVSIRHIWPPI
jgi:hypothetical protein